MNQLWCVIILAALTIDPAGSVQKGSGSTYFVQLIHGTNAEKAQNAGWKPVDPKVSRVLSTIFTWGNYWEVKREAVVVTAGRVSNVKVTADRNLEIKLLKNGQTELRLYRANVLKRIIKTSGDSNLSILGGDSAGKNGWFIVVRRDRPSTE